MTNAFRRPKLASSSVHPKKILWFSQIHFLTWCGKTGYLFAVLVTKGDVKVFNYDLVQSVRLLRVFVNSNWLKCDRLLDKRFYNVKFRACVLEIVRFQRTAWRLGDEYIFSWSDPHFIQRRFSTERGFTRTKISCYGRTDYYAHIYISYTLLCCVFTG